MRKLILNIFILLFYIFFFSESILAKNAYEKEVRHVAQDFLTYKSRIKSRVLQKQIQYTIIGIEPLRDPSGLDILAYIVGIEPKGFLIMAADTDLEPVIAYSFRHDWDFKIDKDNVLYKLLFMGLKVANKDSYNMNLHRIKENDIKWYHGFIAEKMEDIMFYQWPEEGSTVTGGWVETTWHQRDPYNIFCPIDKITGKRGVVGCGATAMAQIINYHHYIGDLKFTGEDKYETYEGIEIDADSLTNKFPGFDSLNTYLDSISFKYHQYEEIDSLEQAALSFACGISIKNNYTYEASGAPSERMIGSFQDKMNYHSADFMVVNSSIELYRLLIHNMMNGFPAILVISGSGLPDHVIIADGYNIDGYFHLNFGWGSTIPSPITDMWCVLPDSIANNYDSINSGVINIKPFENIHEPRIIISDSVVYVPVSRIGEASDPEHITVQNIDDDAIEIYFSINSANFLISATGIDFDTSIEPTVLQSGEELNLSIICIPDIEGGFFGRAFVKVSHGQGEKFWAIDLISNGIKNGTRIDSGSVSGIWERSGSLYYICGDIFITPGEELTIEPGVEIIFNGPYQFSIASDAQLVAKGTETDSIIFRAFNVVEGWQGFSFSNSDNDDTLAYCHVTNVNTQGEKAVIEINSSDPTFTFCRIENNEAGAFLLNQSSAKIIALSVNANKSIQHGGAFNLYKSSPYISNSVIYKNEATRGGAIYGYESSPSLVNLTIANNTAYDKGGAIFVTGKSLFNIRNSIIWTNEANSGLIVASEDAPNANIITFNYSDIDTNSSNWLYLSDISDKDKMILWEDENKCEHPGQNFSYLNEFYKYDTTCVDTGDPDPAYYDIEDPLRPGIPLYAKGWLRNDMGAYGGPYKNVTYTDSKQQVKLMPRKFSLFQNYPNPFNARTIINYELPITNYVELNVYNILGQKMANLISEKQKAGFHTVKWDASGMASGVYYYRLMAGEYVGTKKLVVLK